MSVTYSPAGNLPDPNQIQSDVTAAAKVDKYVGLKNAPVTWNAKAVGTYAAHIEYPHQPPNWKVT